MRNKTIAVIADKETGVVAAYDIRTDKWDIALDAMEKVNRTRSRMSKLS